MEKDILHDDISQLLELITEQCNIIKEYEDGIPQIEMDLLKMNVVRLYDDLCSLDKISKGIPAIVKMPGSPSLLKIKPAEGKVKPKEEKKEDTVAPKPLAAAKEKETMSEKAPKAKEIPPKLNPPARNTLDLFSTAGKTAADQFANEDDRSLASRLQQNKLEDIKTVIGINDKFAFIHELFGGNLKEYNDAITTLNAMSSLEEAERYLASLEQDNNWKEMRETYLKLVQFTRRKFM